MLSAAFETQLRAWAAAVVAFHAVAYGEVDEAVQSSAIEAMNRAAIDLSVIEATNAEECSVQAFAFLLHHCGGRKVFPSPFQVNTAVAGETPTDERTPMAVGLLDSLMTSSPAVRMLVLLGSLDFDPEAWLERWFELGGDIVPNNESFALGWHAPGSGSGVMHRAMLELLEDDPSRKELLRPLVIEHAANFAEQAAA